MDIFTTCLRVAAFLLLALSLYLRPISAYSYGPPTDEFDELCTDLRPRHAGPPAESHPPYTITWSSKCASPGDVVRGEFNSFTTSKTM